MPKPNMRRDWKNHPKVDWTKFRIVVPNTKEKKKVQEAMEYLHYRLSKDEVERNLTASQFVSDHRNSKRKPSRIVVNPMLYWVLQKQSPDLP